MMELFWAPRTRALRALWMLEEAGIAYERRCVDLAAGEQRGVAFREINPLGKVPALRDGAVCVAESAAICAYVAEAVPDAGLAPSLGDPRRGRYLQWLFFAAGCIEGAFIQKMQNVAISESVAGFGSFERTMAVLEEALTPGSQTPGPWILGDTFSAADVMIGCDLFFSIHIFKMVEARPAFAAYLDRCMARPAFARAHAIDTADA